MEIAVKAGHHNLTKWLLEDRNASVLNASELFLMATESGNKDSLDFLYSKYAKNFTNTTQLLQEALLSGIRKSNTLKWICSNRDFNSNLSNPIFKKVLRKLTYARPVLLIRCLQLDPGYPYFHGNRTLLHIARSPAMVTYLINQNR